MKIAPDLLSFLAQFARNEVSLSSVPARVLLAQAQALAAVARAAERFMAIRTPGGGGAWVQSGAGGVDRALSRLRRLSTPTTKPQRRVSRKRGRRRG